jgi:hypothetical protein
MSKFEFFLFGFWVLILLVGSISYWSEPTSQAIPESSQFGQVKNMLTGFPEGSPETVQDAASTSLEFSRVPQTDGERDITAFGSREGSNRKSSAGSESRPHRREDSAREVAQKSPQSTTRLTDRRPSRRSGIRLRSPAFPQKTESLRSTRPFFGTVDQPGATIWPLQGAETRGAIDHSAGLTPSTGTESTSSQWSDAPKKSTREIKSHRPTPPADSAYQYAYNENYYCRTAREIREVCANGGASSERYEFCLSFGGYYTNGRHCGFLP